jgi:hypothetical protein
MKGKNPTTTTAAGVSKKNKFNFIFRSILQHTSVYIIYKCECVKGEVI